MSDLIRREDAMQVAFLYPFFSDALIEEIKAIPSADRPQDDEFKNFDRGDLIALIEAQKERIGELLADRRQGEWEEVEKSKDSDGHAMLRECTCCGRSQLWMNAAVYNYCPNCGARMKGADDE